jgi:hypothetical protein
VLCLIARQLHRFVARVEGGGKEPRRHEGIIRMPAAWCRVRPAPV